MFNKKQTETLDGSDETSIGRSNEPSVEHISEVKALKEDNANLVQRKIELLAKSIGLALKKHLLDQSVERCHQMISFAEGKLSEIQSKTELKTIDVLEYFS